LKNKTALLLLLGDWLVLSVFAFFTVFHSSYHPNLAFDLGVAILPFLFTWSLVGAWGQGFEPHMKTGKFLLLWGSAGLLAQALRWGLFFFTQGAWLSLPGMLLDLLEGAIWLLGWRLVFSFVYRVSLDPARPQLKKAIWSLLLGLTLAGLLFCLPFVYTQLRYSKEIFTIATIPSGGTALVFGAGVWPDGTPSQVLVERVSTASELYRAGKLRKIIFSGDDLETRAMQKLATDSGVQAQAIILDTAGYDTYSSCRRAREVYAASSLVLVSQRYHLPRALFTCAALGLESTGVAAQDDTEEWPETSARQVLRELPATALAWWETLLAAKK